MSKKKILFVTRSLTRGGGEAKSTINIINNLDKDKYDVFILELEKGSKKIEISNEVVFLPPIVDVEENTRIKLHQYLKKPDQIAIDFKNDYDCVIACNRGLTSLFASYIPSIKKIVWIRGTIKYYGYTQIEDIQIRELLKKQYDKQNEIFYKYDKVVLVSDSVYDDFINIFKEHKDKAIKIYNSVDPDDILKKSLEETDVIIPKTKNLLITVGRLKEVKNHKLLIDAMRLVVNDVKDATLLIIGEGTLYNELKEYITVNHLDENIKLLGFYDNPYPIIKQGKLFCLSSISEGFCLSISEACILNIPFVATDVGGVREILDTSPCGVITSSNSEEFASKITELLTKKDLYDTYKQNCQIASKRFSVKDLGHKVEKLIDNLFEEEVENKND